MAFAKRLPGVNIVKTQEEILHDPAIQLVLSSQIANERAPLAFASWSHERIFFQISLGSPR
jgi:hypothetical protein